jgi:hypothetical protein
VAYNLIVPTPFYHLNVAENLLTQPELPIQIKEFLQANRAAFLLGNTAPDVQTVSGQDRSATHFFDLPLTPGGRPAWEVFLDRYPSLASSAGLPAEQAAFLAGYLCHLQADWWWVAEIFNPVFGVYNTWKTFRHRLYLHNVLRSYLDLEIVEILPEDTGVELEKASPSRWLPFVEDQYLDQWREILVNQLCPGCPAQTVEVFAARQGIPVDEFYRLLNSEELLEEQIFSRLPRQTLQDYRQHLIEENSRLLEYYLMKMVKSRHS